MCDLNSSALAVLEPLTGQVLHSSHEDYSILACLGEGLFGEVLKCQNLRTKEMVALKVMKKGYEQVLENELSILKLIRVLDADKAHLIRFYEHFVYMDYGFLAFEMLDINLYTLMDQRDWKPLSVTEICPIAQQLLVALDYLKDLEIIHTDIKPDNIMLLRKTLQPVTVKLIDFGLAVRNSNKEIGLILQPGGFRAPEVSIGLPYNEAVDVWGLGCVLAFLFIGENLLNVECEYQQMKRVLELVGMPRDEQLWAGLHTSYFFTQDEDDSSWRLMTPEEFQDATNIVPAEQHQYYVEFSTLDDLVNLHPVDEDGESEEREAFVDLLKKLLCVEGEERITPRQALFHRVLTTSNLLDSSTTWSSTFTDSTSVRASDENDSFSLILEEVSDQALPSQDHIRDQSSGREKGFPRSLKKRIQKFFGQMSSYFCCCFRPTVND